MEIKEYCGNQVEWDNFIENSINGTIFHKISFLSYHKFKFEKETHHLMFYNNSELIAVIPLALMVEENRKILKSPYGASYGGFVFKYNLNYKNSKDLVECFLNWVKENDIREILISPSIPIYSKDHSDTFLFSLIENGFKISNYNITSVLKLNSNWENKIHESRERNIKKAIKSGIEIIKYASIDDFWITINKTFDRHNAKSTHNYDEWKWLCENNYDNIWNEVAYFEGCPVAGLGMMQINKNTRMSFYICNDFEYQKKEGLSLLIYESLKSAFNEGVLNYDFGTASVNSVARPNIFEFKERFGSDGFFRTSLIWQS